MSDGDTTPKPGATRWIVPAIAFLVGAGAMLALVPPAPAPAPGLTVPTAPASSNAEALAEEAELYHQINRQFVEQLRKYHIRLREIAGVAEAEGAASAAKQMQDFALETELLIQRYDKIVKTE